ncbi:hypothetical protein DQ384_38235 [Sphaerisporangium album]|uniref:Uncharacterized protein n=1 Tax=Sphaerisporangium album TaxID=509200 RepID=A0A367EM56_9ACTN|nr:LamG-like jellyroll fold domain-containing protein [Sphaerisporangium album]RCG19121.1 hypothetical protein DQ384_38235 [Sphaerisporangium album]
MALVNQWVDSYALSAGFVIPDPIISTRQIAVANTAGNWLVCSVSWHTGAGAQSVPTVHVGDDVHNYWVPLIRISGVGGGVAIWAAPNARAASRVYLSPTDYVTGLAANVEEHSGLGNYLQVADRKTATISPGTTASITLAAPPSQALALVAGGSDSATATLASATAGWSSAAPVSGTNGVDQTSDTRLLPRFQTTSGSVSVTYTTSAAANIVVAGMTVLTAAAAPAQPNPNWPVVELAAGFGSGAQTPRDAITWTPLPGRLLELDASRGRQFELGTLEAGEAQLRLRNDDGALNPANSSGPFYPNVTDMTPVRVLATWGGRVYPVLHSFMERWPQTWRDPHWGEVNATAVDAWATMTTELPNIAQGEILVDAPYGYWPLSDPDTATSGSNLAEGNTEPMVQYVSKYGPGSAAATFGVDQGMLTGSPNNTAWENRGLTSLQVSNGYSLRYGPVPQMPPVAAGYTAEFWARLDVAASQPAANLGLIAIKNSGLTVIIVYVDIATGNVAVGDWDPVTKARTNSVSSWPALTGKYLHYALTFNTAGWKLYVNAQLVASRVCPLDSTATFVSVCGQADEVYHGRMCNGSFAHVAIYPRILPYGRILAHWWAASSGNENDSPDQRINKLMEIAGWGGPRNISYTTGGYVVPASGIQGQALASAVEEIAATDGAGLYVDDMGYVCETSKTYRYNRTPAYVFGDRPDLGEVPYAVGMGVDRDPGQVANDITATQAHYGRQARAVDDASVQQRGWRTRDAVTHVNDPLGVTDMANYLLMRNKAPGQRIAEIVLDPASNPAIWPTALGIETGDIVAVNRRPMGGVLITGTFEVIGVGHHVVPHQEWRVRLSLAPADPFFFRLDDATYGVLDGPGVLGW